LCRTKIGTGRDFGPSIENVWEENTGTGLNTLDIGFTGYAEKICLHPNRFN
jgi:hypothetical protein